MEEELNNHAYCVFELQDNHHFVFCFSIVGHDARMSIYSRSGVIHSSVSDIVQFPFAFLHLIAGITFVDDKYLGCDLSITSKPAKPRTVMLNKPTQLSQQSSQVL